MAEASGSRRDHNVTSDDSEDQRERPRSSQSRRRGHYESQRVSRSSRPTTGETSKSRGKRASYQYPSNFANLDEQAVGPPVGNIDDRGRLDLEQNIRDGSSSPEKKRDRRTSDRRDRPRKRKSAPPGEQELTEVAGPPPIQKNADEEAAGPTERQGFLENKDRGDDDGASPPFQQKKPEDYVSKNQDAEVPRYLTELYSISYLIFFAILGTLARLGTQWITFYPGTPIVTPVIWANFGGSMIMGFMAEDQGLFRDTERDQAKLSKSGEKKRRKSQIQEDDLAKLTKAEHTKRKKTIPLYIGITTGFCGSFTSFSSFARDFFLALSNNLPTPIDHPHPGLTGLSPTTTVHRNGGYSFEAFIHVVLYTLALSLGALIVGAQIAIFLGPYTPRIHGRFVRQIFDPAMAFLGFGCWLGAVFMAIWPPDRPGGPSSRGSWARETWRGEVIFALVFAPLGCLLRFYASLKLNGLVPAFPLGTFAVNMLGTAIEGMCFDIQHVGVGVMGRAGGGRVGCQVLQGVMDGFCGCLTTVSTWVAEINGLKRKHGWAYAFGSILGGLCLMVIIMGSVRWSVGFISPACNTGYTSKVHG